jgi:hypothetical protein
MDRLFLVLMFLGLFLCSAFPYAAAQDAMAEAEVPSLHIMPSKASYEAGERGFAVLVIETYGKISQAEVELELLSSTGALKGGDVISTDIPGKDAGDTLPEKAVTQSWFYSEGVEYFAPEKTVYRVFPFDIPIDAQTGNYTLVGRVSGDGVSLREESRIRVEGPGGLVNLLFVGYIAVLLYSVYLLRRE